jgi:hypothetical protein
MNYSDEQRFIMPHDLPDLYQTDANNFRIDRIYRLLPPVIHLTDDRVGRPLQALMRVLAKQANIVEDDLRALYENWFIETCDDWVVPYLGELVGYKLVPENTPAEVEDSERGRERMRTIVPRSEVADTIRFRRRKGSLLLLEEIARAAVGWPSRAVEYRELMAAHRHARFPEIARSRTLDLRRRDVARHGYGPFDGAIRLVDVRRLDSTHTRGRGNVSSIGLWVWRLKSLLVKRGNPGTRGRTELADHVHRFTFHPLGIDQPLFTQAERPPEPVGPADEFSVPAPLTRRALRDNLERFYGSDKSLFLKYRWPGEKSTQEIAQQASDDIPWTRVEVADLTHWENSLPGDHPFRRRDFPPNPEAGNSEKHPYVVLDPERGRMLVRAPFEDQGPSRRERRPHTKHQEFDLDVRYHYGSAAAIGGGDYPRRLPPVRSPCKLWRVARTKSDEAKHAAPPEFSTLRAALDAWDRLSSCQGPPRRVVIEIDDDGTFELGLGSDNRFREMRIGPDETLLIRAAAHRRPVIFEPGGESADRSWEIRGETPADSPGPAGSFALQGLMVGGLNLIISGNLRRVSVQDSTLLAPELRGQEQPYANLVLELRNLTGCLSLDRSVVIGSIRVDWDEFPTVPITIEARDSILDGAGSPLRSAALTGFDVAPAFASVLLQRCTVVGRMHVDRVSLAEDTIFTGRLQVAETNLGCLRFCSVPPETAFATPATTPPRYACQPDLFLREYKETHSPESSASDHDQSATASAVTPRFVTRRFGDATYMQLAEDGPEQIRHGASDESEMGAFHDLYVPQRINLLRARLAEFTPAGSDAAILFAT